MADWEYKGSEHSWEGHGGYWEGHSSYWKGHSSYWEGYGSSALGRQRNVYWFKFGGVGMEKMSTAQLIWWRVCDSLNPHVYYRVLAVTHMVRFFDYPFFRILFQLEN